MKPTAGFTYNQFLPMASEAIVSVRCFLYYARKSIVTLCARRIP
jgi:hypothetical protein